MALAFRGQDDGCVYCDFYEYAKKDHFCQRGRHMGYKKCGWYDNLKQDAEAQRKMVMSGKVMVPIITHHYDDEDYVLVVSGYDKDSSVCVERFYVDSTTFDNTSVLDFVCFDKGCMSREDDIVEE